MKVFVVRVCSGLLAGDNVGSYMLYVVVVSF